MVQFCFTVINDESIVKCVSSVSPPIMSRGLVYSVTWTWSSLLIMKLTVCAPLMSLDSEPKDSNPTSALHIVVKLTGQKIENPNSQQRRGECRQTSDQRAPISTSFFILVQDSMSGPSKMYLHALWGTNWSNENGVMILDRLLQAIDLDIPQENVRPDRGRRHEVMLVR